MLKAIEQESIIQLQIPIGFAHPKRRDDFGLLPLPPLPAQTRKDFALTPQPTPLRDVAPNSPIAEKPPAVAAVVPAVPRRSNAESQPDFFDQEPRRRRRRMKTTTLVVGVLIGLFLLFNGALIYFARKNRVGPLFAADSGAQFNSPARRAEQSTADDWQANIVMAVRLLAGQEVPRDVTAATNRLWRAVEAGHAPSMTLLAELLMRGDLIPKDVPAATRWLKTSAELGHAPAQTTLADTAFVNPPALPFPEALRYYEMAAEQEWPRALAALGVLYSEGKRVPRDEKRSRDLVKRAAFLNEPRAQFSHGIALLNSQPGTTGVAEAVRWFRASAEQGFPPGQNAYGYQLSRGDGVEKDLVEAWKWYELAAAERDPNAIANMQIQRSLLTTDQMEEARRRAAKFQPRFLGAPPFLVPAVPSKPRMPVR
jgi:TPR repeat protein